MNYIYQKFWFLIMLMLGVLIVISSNSWLSAWMGLEINLMSFMPLIIKNNSFSTESAVMYFIFQTFASLIFLFSIIMYLTFNNILLNFISNKYMFFIIMISLMMKMGGAPFHFWVPIVMENLNWMNNFILMTWQKMGPMVLIFYILKIKLLSIFIISSLIISMLGGLNQLSIRKLMAFSSINQISWMLISLMINELMWKVYFFMYAIIVLLLIFMLHVFNIFYLNQLFAMNMKTFIIKILLFMNMLSLGGLPPFLGFFPKFLIIKKMLILNLNYMMILMMIFTLIMLFFYLRLMYTSFLLNMIIFKVLFKNLLLMKFLLIISFINNFLLMMMLMLYF